MLHASFKDLRKIFRFGGGPEAGWVPSLIANLLRADSDYLLCKPFVAFTYASYGSSY